ncbi:PD-(D/E)XK nuclease family protein [Candidatus Azambacteria bacterium]|nr:PD-(D/E)XK nuclease family protein [Candidatus Azambacteria bacterium]
MSKFYNPKRSRNIFDPVSKTPFKLSRSKIDNFLSCPKCFYLDRRLGIGQPPGFPFNLNKAVDTLLKKEFDIHRAAGNPHPLMKAYKIDAIPFKHENMEKWRDALSEGIQYFHEPTNLIITGAIDDIWVDPQGNLIIVDYKATSKSSEINLDAEWQGGYKRQMEIYQWLFRKNDFKVSDTGYFVYCNGNADKEAFDGKLEFDIKLLPYKGDDSWVEKTVFDAHKCLMGNEIPKMSADCDFCRYREAAGGIER